MVKLRNIAPAISPEAELLVCCVSTDFSANLAEQVKALTAKKLDWDLLLKMARIQNIRPLTYWRLKTICSDLVPEAVLSNLQVFFNRNLHRNLKATAELISILNLLGSQGITAIPYKGPALTTLAYGNLGLREFIDLDILVRTADVWRVRDLLGSQKYKSLFELDDTQQNAFLNYMCEYFMHHNEKKISVEIHWDMVPEYFSLRQNVGDLWLRAVPIKLGNSNILSLSIEDLLINLCVHGSKHRWAQLKWICDIAELINTHQAIDWDQAISLARKIGAERMLLLGLFLARQLLNAPLPDEVLKLTQKDPMIKSLALEVCQLIFSSEKVEEQIIKESVFHLKAKEKVRDKVSYCFRRVMTPMYDDWVAWPLPPSLRFLYYPFRVFRLLSKYGPGI